jgi:hypothetical protein
MNPYGSESGSSPQAEADLGQTRYFPPQEGYRAQEAPQQTPQPATSAQQPGGNGPSYYPAERPSMQRHHYAPYAHGRDRTMLGLLLLGGGILFLLAQFSFFPGFGDLVLLLLGGVFLYAYFNTRPGYRIGFLIPGSILLGLGVGQLVSDVTFIRLFGGDLTAVCLGLGFCLIWFLERKHWWALIPGGILVLTGLGSALRIGSLWPLLLIGLGIYLLYDQSRRRQSR